MPRLSGSNYGKIGQTQAVIDLVVSSGTATPITISGDLAAQLVIYSTAEFFFTLAESVSAAATRLSSDTTRGRLPAGLYTFPIAGESINKFYIISTGSGVTDGVSYFIIDME
jgi:hypothetical protein